MLTTYEVFKKTTHRRRKVLWTERLYPPEIYAEALTPKETVCGSGPLGSNYIMRVEFSRM